MPRCPRPRPNIATHQHGQRPFAVSGGNEDHTHTHTHTQIFFFCLWHTHTHTHTHTNILFYFIMGTPRVWKNVQLKPRTHISPLTPSTTPKIEYDTTMTLTHLPRETNCRASPWTFSRLGKLSQAATCTFSGVSVHRLYIYRCMYIYIYIYNESIYCIY